MKDISAISSLLNMVASNEGFDPRTLHLDGSQCEGERGFSDLLKLVENPEIEGAQQKEQAPMERILQLDRSQWMGKGAFSDLLRLVENLDSAGAQQKNQVPRVTGLDVLLSSMAQGYDAKDLLAFLNESGEVESYFGDGPCKDPEAAQKSERGNDLVTLIKGLNWLLKGGKNIPSEEKDLHEEEGHKAVKDEDVRDDLKLQQEGNQMVGGPLLVHNPYSSGSGPSTSRESKDNSEGRVFFVQENGLGQQNAPKGERKASLEVNPAQSPLIKGPEEHRENVGGTADLSRFHLDGVKEEKPVFGDSSGAGALFEARDVPPQNQGDAPFPIRVQVSSRLLAEGMDRTITILRSSSGEKRGVIQIEPPELGKVRVVVHSDHNTVNVRVTVDGPEVGHVIQQASDGLRNALEKRGLVLGEFSVDVGDSGHQGTSRHNEFYGFDNNFLGALAEEDNLSALEEDILLGRLDVSRGVWHWVV